jgi:hypothetical protein
VTATSRGSSIDSLEDSGEIGLVSIVTSFASGPSLSRIGRVKVPTPGPYSTNSLVFAQSTGLEHLVDQDRLDGMIDPTITGFLRKPRRNCQRGLGARSRAAHETARALQRARGERFMDAPSGPAKGGSVGKCAAAWQVPRRSARLRERGNP